MRKLRPGALNTTIASGSPRSVLYVTSVLSLRDSNKSLASGLSVNVTNLVFSEAILMPHFLEGISDWSVLCSESLHL